MSAQAWTLGALFAFAVALAFWAQLAWVLDALRGVERRDELFVESRLFRGALPFIQAIARRLATVRALAGARARLGRRLAMAGKRDAISPDEVLGTSVVCAAAGLALAAYVDLTMGVDSLVYPLLGAVSAGLPFMGIGDMIERRHAKIRKALPYALDLLTLAVEAGLDFTAALSRIGEKLQGSPFQEEVRRLSRDLAMGKTRGEALRDMAERVRLDDLKAVASALVQADELGSPLGPTLRLQAAELRRRRFQLAEKKALEAPVKMLFPLVVFIFPIVFMVVFAPIGIRFLQERPF